MRLGDLQGCGTIDFTACNQYRTVAVGCRASQEWFTVQPVTAACIQTAWRFDHEFMQCLKSSAGKRANGDAVKSRSKSSGRQPIVLRIHFGDRFHRTASKIFEVIKYRKQILYRWNYPADGFAVIQSSGVAAPESNGHGDFIAEIIFPDLAAGIRWIGKDCAFMWRTDGKELIEFVGFRLRF